ncbi:MAG: glutamate-5-semialdehyde dehydrogenase [Paludibacteraceae bacterium]|nr:glutamate-5-semialdehyde dehydrogenase [Paludibacteraceae bacterium]MBQ2590644.1 glutamate-5-semialdehyde dehydrogenase [Paludibacteraceae bacterium]
MTSIDWKTAVRNASRTLNLVGEEKKNELLLALADATEKHIDEILKANAEDLSKMDKSDSMYDRLLLTEDRLKGIAADIRKVAQLPSPLNKVLEQRTLPNGLELKKVSVPFGVIGIIYEARPNVSFDVFSLCFKSGNACVLKGGTNAHASNSAIVALIQNVLKENGIDENVVHLMPAGRESTAELLNAVGSVDMIIPRGSAGLINFVRENSRVPVIETGAGVVSTYFDAQGDVEKGKKIINNGKTRRVSVCNALDSLIVHRSRLSDLAELLAPLAESNVIIEADEESYDSLKGHYPDSLLKPLTETSYGTEYKDYKMNIKTVADIDEAIAHITKYDSGHSEAIITEDDKAAAKFQTEVDAACVYVNAPTSFTDGGQFGMGAEIGISTQKLHARGPMALPEMTSYKWLIKGDGQVRPK